MNNYINLRIETRLHSKTINDIKHNLRFIKSLNTQNDNKNIYIDKNGNKFTSKETKRKILREYYQDRDEHNKLFKKLYKRNLRDSQHSSYIGGVFTFSEALKHDLGVKYSQNELDRVAFECVKDLAQTMGSEVKYLAYHTDETTNHYHFHLKNYDKDGRTIKANKYKTTKQLEVLQDLAFKHFKKLGMDRGIKKNLTNMNYKTTKQHHQEEINKLNFQSNETKQDLEEKITELEKLRKDVKNLELSTEEKREARKKISAEIKTIKTDLKKFKLKTSKDVDSILKATKKVVGYDTELLRNSIVRYIVKNKATSYVYNDLDTFQYENNKLEYQLKSILNEKHKLNHKINSSDNEKINKIQSLEDDNTELKKELKSANKKNNTLESENERLSSYEKFVKSNPKRISKYELFKQSREEKIDLK